MKCTNCNFNRETLQKYLIDTSSVSPSLALPILHALLLQVTRIFVNAYKIRANLGSKRGYTSEESKCTVLI